MLRLVYDWCSGPVRPTEQGRRGIVSPRLAIKVSAALTKLCGDVLIREPIGMIGGMRGNVPSIVQADESVFRKRKYHRGRHVTTRWVFGMIACEYDPPRPILYMVGNRARVTLEPLIVAHCEPGSTIYTDEWRAYANLSNIGFNHRTVNHSRHFVDPVSGVNTNTIENAWRWAKDYISNYRVTTDERLYEHLQAYMWRCWKGRPHPLGSFHRMLEDIVVEHPF